MRKKTYSATSVARMLAREHNIVPTDRRQINAIAQKVRRFMVNEGVSPVNDYDALMLVDRDPMMRGYLERKRFGILKKGQRANLKMAVEEVGAEYEYMANYEPDDDACTYQGQTATRGDGEFDFFNASSPGIERLIVSMLTLVMRKLYDGQEFDVVGFLADCRAVYPEDRLNEEDVAFSIAVREKLANPERYLVKPSNHKYRIKS